MEKKPNILWITTDHHLFHGHEGVLRPNYEKFCNNALEFNRAYTVCPLCCPARRTMLDGLYPHKHGVIDNDTNPPLTEETYYDSLLKNGYDCRYLGKWHAGCDPVIPGVNMLTEKGYGCPYIWDDYHKYLEEKKLSRPEAYIEYSLSNRNFYKEGETLDLTTVKNLFSQTFGTMTSDKDTHELFYLANRANEVLNEVAGGEKPFCLRLEFYGPHQPYFPTQEFLSMYDPEKIKVYPTLHHDLKNKPEAYKNDHGAGLEIGGKLIQPTPLSDETWKRLLWYAYAHTSMADAAIGRVLDEVEKLNLLDNTVIIISSDHGDAIASHGGHIDKDNYLPEEVLRIPLAIMYKGKIKPEKSNELVSNLDIPTTVAKLSGTGFTSPVDGIDLLNSKERQRDYFVSVTHGHFNKTEGRALISGNYKYVYNHLDTDELYNLAKDTYETDNLINNASYADKLKEMRQKLKEWQELYKDPLASNMGF